MQLTILGATGAVGSECLKQALEAGHKVTVLVRSRSKLPGQYLQEITVVEGNALNREDVTKALPAGTEAILFAVGVDKHSQQDLCTDITRHVLELMPELGIKKLVWCGGGSTLVEEDQITLGARFVEFFARVFMSLRHHDKTHQYALLKQHPEIFWVGVRPLQIRTGPLTGEYRTGFDKFSGTSWISFADVAHAMLSLLADQSWDRRAPIVQY